MKSNKFYYLPGCSTCKKILNQLKTGSCELQNIKETKISAKELDKMAKLAGSYEALFSRKAIKYRTMGLKDKKLNEKDYRKLILSDYTFLKRPVLLSSDAVFSGYTNEAVNGMKNILNNTKGSSA